MKKIIILMLSFLCLCGCNLMTKDKIVKDYKKDGIVLEFINSSLLSSKKDLASRKSTIVLFSDKTIEYFNKNESKVFKLTDEEFDKIINCAFGSEFNSLDDDIGDSSTMDGYYSYVTLYYEEDNQRTIGGYSPSNKVFKKLVSLLYEYINNKEEEKNIFVIKYNICPNYGSVYDILNDNETIYLYKNKTIMYINGNGNTGSIKLTDEEYNEITNYAFGEEFNSLDNNVSGDISSDGSYESIVVYYDNGIKKTVYGDNSTNKTFKKMVNLLYNSLKEKNEKKEGIVIEYSISPNFGSMDDMINDRRTIVLFGDKTIQYKEGNDNPQTFKLSDEEYNEIINFAFGEEFNSLDNNVSDNSIMDGNHEAITIYYEDGTEKTVGGNNPNNKIFDKLISLLYEYINV